MKPIRLLIVDDEEEPRNLIRRIYEAVLPRFEFLPEITAFDTAKEAKLHALQVLKQGGKPYDLASLDLDMGDSEVHGINILEALKVAQSAWTVVVLTGLEMNPQKAAKTYSHPEELEKLLQGFRSEVQQTFWPKRSLTIAKPHPCLPVDEQNRLLRTGIEQAVKFYKDLEPKRYMFRMVKIPRMKKAPKLTKKEKNQLEAGDDGIWQNQSLPPRRVFQIQCGCGEMVELDQEHWNGLATMHELFKKGPGGVITSTESEKFEPYNQRNSKRQNTTVEPVENTPGKVEKHETSVREYFVRNGHPAWNSYDFETRMDLIEGAVPWLDDYGSLRRRQDIGISLNENDQKQLTQWSKDILHSLAEVWYLWQANERSPKIAPEPGDVNLTRKRKTEPKSKTRFRKMKSQLISNLRDKNILTFAKYIEDHVKGVDHDWTLVVTKNEVFSWKT